MNMMKMMQKAGQMKSKMQEMQASIQDMEVEGEASGGLVKCKISGRFEIKTLTIDKSLVNPDEVDLLEDIVMAALNDAHSKASKTIADETQKIMSDLGLPPGFEMPF